MNKIGCRLRKNDKVKVLVGKDRGKIGKILKVDAKKGLLVIEHVNMVKHHMRPNTKNPQGGIVEQEGGVHHSNVMMMCDKCMAPSRIKIKILEGAKKVRYCVKCGEVLDA